MVYATVKHVEVNNHCKGEKVNCTPDANAGCSEGYNKIVDRVTALSFTLATVIEGSSHEYQVTSMLNFKVS